jgi:hypothetical protein
MRSAGTLDGTPAVTALFCSGIPALIGVTRTPQAVGNAKMRDSSFDKVKIFILTTSIGVATYLP